MNQKWLTKTFRVAPQSEEVILPAEVVRGPAKTGEHERQRGRPVIPFADCSGRSKGRKVSESRAEINGELLCRAANVPRVPPHNVLAFFLANSFSKAQYESIRQFSKAWHCDIYPSYNELREAKKECRPRHIEVTETRASVPLHSLLQHTARRFLESKSEDELDAMEPELTLVAKWECDGSSGHSVNSQPFSSAETSDAAVFLTSLVPLQLRHKRNETSWHNPTPSSNRFCGPLRFEFVKETKEVI